MTSSTIQDDNTRWLRCRGAHIGRCSVVLSWRASFRSGFYYLDVQEQPEWILHLCSMRCCSD